MLTLPSPKQTPLWVQLGPRQSARHELCVRGILCIFVKSSVSDRILSMSSLRPVDFKRDLIKYLHKQSVRVARFSPEVYRHPSGGSVHQLRKAALRIRATLWLLKRSSARLHFNNLQRDLRRLEQSLGSVRELDVAILDANHYRVDTERLAARRRIAEARLRLLVTPTQTLSLQRQLSQTEAFVRAEDRISLRAARRHLRTQLRNRRKKHIHGPARLHRLRVLLKRAQYALEAMGESVDPIKRLQRILGAAHDLEFLQSSTRQTLKLRKRQHSLNSKSVRLAKPVLRFAAAQIRK